MTTIPSLLSRPTTCPFDPPREFDALPVSAAVISELLGVSDMDSSGFKEIIVKGMRADRKLEDAPEDVRLRTDMAIYGVHELPVRLVADVKTGASAPTTGHNTPMEGADDVGIR